MNYQDRVCGDCVHLERVADVVNARTGTRCRESLHLVIAMTERGPQPLPMYAPVAPGYPACSRFVEKGSPDGGEAGSLVRTGNGPQSPVGVTAA